MNRLLKNNPHFVTQKSWFGYFNTHIDDLTEIKPIIEKKHLDFFRYSTVKFPARYSLLRVVVTMPT